MTEPSLAGKVAIITGSGSPIGMGDSMAAATVEAGGRVAMFDINPDWLEESAAEIRSIGGEDCALPIVVDVTEPDAVADAVASVIGELGELEKEDLIPSDVIKAPYRWLASDASSDFTGRRIVAYHWDESLPLENRLQQASAPAAWPQLGGFPRPRR